jgi:hypothetical protein
MSAMRGNIGEIMMSESDSSQSEVCRVDIFVSAIKGLLLNSFE